QLPDQAESTEKEKHDHDDEPRRDCQDQAVDEVRDESPPESCVVLWRGYGYGSARHWRRDRPDFLPATLAKTMAFLQLPTAPYAEHEQPPLWQPITAASPAKLIAKRSYSASGTSGQ